MHLRSLVSKGEEGLHMQRSVFYPDDLMARTAGPEERLLKQTVGRQRMVMNLLLSRKHPLQDA